jgi:serine/threonine-protein kinase
VAFVVFAKPFATTRVVVPKVVGASANRATQLLERKGLKVTTHGVQSSVKPGLVVSQDPAARSEADKGSTVDLAVSSGPGQQVVPSVVNLPAKEAVTTLNDAGFKVTQDPQTSATVPQGIAIKTSPKENAVIPKGSEVRLFVSSGPPKVTVPGVVGQDENVARGTLEDAKLRVSRTLVTSTAPKGQVTAQSPASGSTVDAGTRVTLTVSKGPEKVSVPDVVGQDKNDARATLRDAGFSVTVVQKESDQTKNSVIRQSPPAGTKAVKGDTVTIYVAIPKPGTGGAGPGGTSTTPDNTQGQVPPTTP